MIEAYLGIDIGGTGVKAAVFDRNGTLLASARRSYSPDSPGPGLAELSATALESSIREAVREAAGACRADIRALSIVSQGQTFVTLDEHGKPIHPAILWYDSRAAEQADELHKKLEAVPEPRPDPETIATAPKILWLRRRDPNGMARARRHLLLPDLVTFRLTGKPVTDPQTASSTGLSLGGCEYHLDTLAAAGIHEDRLAPIMPSGTSAGRVSAEAALDWGLSPGTRVIVGTNDQYAGALGAGLTRPGLLSAATGTCLALVTLTDKPPGRLPPGLWSGEFPIPGFWFILAFSKTAGIALEWFQRVLAPGVELRRLDEEAAGSPIGSRGVTVCPHFDGALSPDPDPSLRGLFGGLALHHTRGDLFRGLMESLAFGLKDNIRHLEATGLPIEEIRAIGGGAKSDFWLQMQADVTGLRVRRPAAPEAASLGAAMLAAAGSGAYSSIQKAVEGMYRTGRTFEPNASRTAQYEPAYRRYRNVLTKSAMGD